MSISVGVSMQLPLSTSRMFPYFETVIGFSIITYAWESYLKWRQHKRYRISQLPDELREIGIDSDKWVKAQAYGLDKSRLEIVWDTVDSIESVLFLLLGGLRWSWDGSTLVLQALGFADPSAHPLLRYSMLFASGLVVIAVSNIPFELYSTFVVEEKHGFNKKTMRLFVVDMLKTQALILGIGTPFMLLVVSIVKWTGAYFWFYAAVFVVIVQLLLLATYPTLIAPLFNKFLPFPDGELRTGIEDLARRVGFPLKGLFQMDGSKRSAHSNAFLFGFFKNKRIVLYDTLMKQLDMDELLAVLGHEFGHWAHWDLWRNVGIGFGYVFCFMFAFAQFIYSSEMYESFGFDTIDEFVGLVLFVLVAVPIDHALSLLTNLHSRWCEYRADAYARANLGLDLSSALVKIHSENLADFYPDPWYSAYNFSHPTLLERLRNLKKVSVKLD